MFNGKKEFTKSGKRKRASYSEVCRWIVDSWKDVTVTCIKNGIRKPELIDYENDISNEENQDVEMSHYDSDTEIEDNETFGSEFNENNQTNNGNVTCDLAEEF